MPKYDYQSLRFEIEGHVGILTLNRPDKLNAIDDEMHSELLDAFLKIRGEYALRVVLMKAEGRAFSAGGDLNAIVQLQSDIQHRSKMCDEGQRIVHALIDIPVPVVTALSGDAMGLGASIALGGDIVVASKNARIADPHVRVGLVAGDGGVLFWPASIGMHRARRYLLTGDMLPAEQAYQFGLVTDLADTPEACISTAREIADRIAGLSPIAVRGTKKALGNTMKMRALESFNLGMAYEHTSGGSQDILEAVAAIREKRKPQFQDR
jgi:enoyl-CoA hydratase